MNKSEKIKMALDRTVPIDDPEYIVGEADALNKMDMVIKSMQQRNGGILGCVVLGQVGNGKTHFLRYIRKNYKKSVIGMYIPDMFVSGPLVDALTGIYKSIFNGPGNHSLSCYLNEWKCVKESEEIQQCTTNKIFKFLQLCTNEVEERLILEYYSGYDMIPDQMKFLRSKFGLKKKIISNEIELYDLAGTALEFIQKVTGKSIVLLFDEVDKIYSADTNKTRMSAVQAKLLTAYRGLFDSLNSRLIKGIVVVGATPEAWSILSTQTAFERRFVDNVIMLKVPKKKEDCIKFIENRYKEINLEFDEEDRKYTTELVSNFEEDRRKTWADVLSNLMKSEVKSEGEEKDPAQEIMEVLLNAISPLTWNEILQESQFLSEIYPKAQPTALLKKLEKEGKIKVNETKPRTYESWGIDNE